MLCVMDLILSVSLILQATKFDMAHLVLVAVFSGANSTKSCFCCIVYKLLLPFLVLWHTKLQVFLQWLQLRHLTLCGTFVARLGPLPHA